MLSKVPMTVEELNEEYLSLVGRKLLADPSVQVTQFELIAEPFEFPRFGQKEFYEIPFRYESRRGSGKATVILRIMPRIDAVMMLTGDTDHRELKAFETGLFERVPKTFHVPYVHVINEPERDQYWAFLEDVRPQMQALGMHAALPPEILRTILSHLAAFHAAFWKDNATLDQPWLMSLGHGVSYFFRTIVDALDGMKNPAESSDYVIERWPWMAEGAVNMIRALPRETGVAVERIYREPGGLLERLESMPMTLCHYDFDNRNLGIEEGLEGRRTVVIDWEIMGKGVSSSDMVRFMMYQNRPDADEYIEHYLDELERHLGAKIDRKEWREGYELAWILEWQIRGVLFAVMANAPSAPVPDDQREGMRERAMTDIGYVEQLVRKHGLV